MHTYIHTYTDIQTYRHAYIHACMHTCIHTLHTYIHACMHTYIDMNLYARTHIFLYLYPRMDIYLHIYIYMFIYTYQSSPDKRVWHPVERSIESTSRRSCSWVSRVSWPWAKTWSLRCSHPSAKNIGTIAFHHHFMSFCWAKKLGTSECMRFSTMVKTVKIIV